MNVCLLITYFSTNNSIIITKREIRNFYRNFHLLPQFHRNKHLKNTATFTATCWKSPREISNFRPQLSQKRPAKSWGDWKRMDLGQWCNYCYCYNVVFRWALDLGPTSPWETRSGWRGWGHLPAQEFGLLEEAIDQPQGKRSGMTFIRR